MAASALVIASDGDRREAIANALEPSIDVVQAEGGLDGLKRLEDSPVDCAVTSVHLTDVPLVGFLDQVREDHPTLPVIVVGRPVDAELISRMFRAGAYEHVPTTDDLLTHVERAVAGRRARAALERHRQLGSVLRGIGRTVADGRTREEIEQAVYDRLVAADLYQVVCVGEYHRAQGELAVHLPVEGTFPARPTEIPGGDGDDHILSRAVDSGEVAVADVPATTRSAAMSAPAAPAAPMVLTAAIPFTHDGSVEGIALVSTGGEAAFDASERAALKELGTIVGAALWRTESPDSVRLPTFVENLVHELRNPLGIALAHLEIGIEDHDPASLERAEDALRQIETLVDDLSKIPPLEGIEETAARDLEAAVDAAWADLDAPDAQLVVEETGPVLADQALFERLLSNLLRNAVEHGGDDVTIQVGVTDGGFFVEDDGSGMSAVAHDRAFERGYSTGDGSGVGLSLVADVVDAHGWSIDLLEGDAGGVRIEITGVEFADDEQPTGG